jgi:hypothetical protein
MTDKIEVVICDYCEYGHIIRGECTNPLCPKSHESCIWTQSNVLDVWDTSCHNEHHFYFMEFKESAFKYCPWCGKPIKDIPYG